MRLSGSTASLWPPSRQAIWKVIGTRSHLRQIKGLRIIIPVATDISSPRLPSPAPLSLSSPPSQCQQCVKKPASPVTDPVLC